MIDHQIFKLPSVKKLEHKNYEDCKKVLDYYDRWDAAAKAKDFHNAEHAEYMIRKIYKRNGIEES